MIDFKINNKGDIVLDKTQKLPRMKMCFFTSRFPAMKISFLQGNESQSKPVANNQMRIRFNTRQDAFSNGKVASLARDREEIEQRIIIALRTEYGDIMTKPDFGSTIFQVKHKDMYSKETQQRLHDIVLQQSRDILEEPSVYIKAEEYDGIFYCQNINIYIFENNKLLYKFSIMER